MLDKYKFKSIFKEELNNFIKYKRSLGYDYEREIYRLKLIDTTLNNLKIKSKKITKKIFSELIKRNGMSNANYARQYGITKDFCKYLISNNYKDIYYEDKHFHVVNNYKPVIFSDDEIKLLFKTMDEYANNYKNKKYYKTFYMYSILFRLIYACGLRVSEVININLEDINFNNNSIKIIDSKRHISRIVIFSNSMKICLENYINKKDINSGLLFMNSKNHKICGANMRKYYREIIKLANLNPKSHIHALRHVFANNALNQMLEKGYDENVVIVYLYKYMGHKSITETEYYLHFTNYNQQKIISNNDLLSKKLYEGVDLDNE
ncbi:MAG: tyrosine-type recombinase/integrase [Bacilli bacterium]|nr:tyrosine-type recombinase/integrase [Bacilli bacterium]